MVKLFGVDIKAIVGQVTNNQLLTGTLTKVVESSRDLEDLTAGPINVETAYNFQGIIEDYDDKYISSTLVQAGDRKVLIIAASITTAPEIGDKITMDGIEYDVADVKTDPAKATYTCQVRK